MPRHQIRNPSLLDPSRLSAPLLSLFPSFSSVLSVSFSQRFQRSFSRCISLSLSVSRAHVKSLKGDEQTTRKPWGLLALDSRKYFRRFLPLAAVARRLRLSDTFRWREREREREEVDTSKATENLVSRDSFSKRNSGRREMDVSRNDSNLESNERSRSNERRFHLFHRACAISRKELRILGTPLETIASSGDIGLFLHAFTRKHGDEMEGGGAGSEGRS